MIRVFDFCISLFSLIVLLPLFALLAIAIKLDSPGPVLFAQERVGKNGKLFKLYKFRSMTADAESKRHMVESLNERGEIVFKVKDDPRITRVGKIIRRCSIDELPQLINILTGEMSLVGPRPALQREVALYSPRDYQRLSVTPGLTGLWQVSGRASLSFQKMVELDLLYIQNRTVAFYFKIVFLTIPAVITAKGAY
jgi:lipopolysaccharide/colanic/teichoic acid biosynthesis glycosyltransferase